jgi:hypothetical protein
VDLDTEFIMLWKQDLSCRGYKQNASRLLMQTLVFPAFAAYEMPEKRCVLLYCGVGLA